MICPNCKCRDSRVLSTKRSKQKYIKYQRKRECLNCTEIYYTSVIIEENFKNALKDSNKIPVNRFS